MNRSQGAIAFGLAWLVAAASTAARAAEETVLQNDQMALRFDRGAGALVAIENKLSGETYQVAGDYFAVEAVEFRLDFAGARLASLEQGPNTLAARYEGPQMTVDVKYHLGPRDHFAEKQVALTATRSYGLKKVVLSRPTFSGGDLRIVAYRYPKFGRPPGGEPTCTFFGRTAKGGLFAGVEVPFDASSLGGRQVTLSYAPSLKIAAAEKLVCEPVYFGVYRRPAGDEAAKATPYRQPGHAAAPGQAETLEDIPRQSESDAMVAMTSAILGPPRFGLVPMACG
jgi:hypothetical protein